MNEATQNLARRIMASRHLRWMDGMQRVHPDCPEDAWRLVRSVWRPYSPTGDRGVAPAYFDETILDLTDPATAGCISALALQRWEAESIAVTPDGPLYAVQILDDVGRVVAVLPMRRAEGVHMWAQAAVEALCWEGAP